MTDPGHDPLPLDTARMDRLVDTLADQHFAVDDHFLSAEEVDAVMDVLQAFYGEGQMKKAGIGTADEFQVNNAIRGDRIRWVDPHNAKPPTQLFIARVRQLMDYFNRTCYLGLKDFEMHYTVYPPGTFYKRHLDQFKQNDHRRLTFLCYLNRAWEPAHGGQLRLYFPEADGAERVLDISPTAGKLVVFRADLLEHEVLLSHAARYSLTGWMLDQISALTFL